MKKFWKKESPATEEKQRARGRAVAAAAMALVVAVSGAGTLTLQADQPAVLTVEPAAVQQQKPEKRPQKHHGAAAVEETAKTGTETPAQTISAKETEAPVQAAPETVPAVEPAPETGAAVPEQQPEEKTEESAPVQDVPAAVQPELEEENGVVTLRQETPELAQEDPLAAPAAADTEENDSTGHTPEDTVLLTPEQIQEALDSGALEAAEAQCIDISDENSFFSWLWEWLFSWSEPQYSGWRTVGSRTYYYNPSTHKKVTGIQSIDKKLYYFNEDGVMQKKVTFGVDVSKYQTKVDWNKVKKAGVKFVIIRIGYRGYGTGALVLDPMFEEHFANARNAGLKVGVYFFTQAVNEAEAKEEAQGCAYVLNGRKLDYPIYYDTEASGASKGNGRADGLGVTDRTKCAIAFCEEVKASRYKPGVYASTTWYRNRIDLSSLRKYSIWNAHYGVASSPIDCDMWQGSEKGRISGYGGDIDVNISYMG